MLLLWKLVDKTQISKHSEPSRHHNSIKLWILLPLRADLLFTLQCEIPCMYFFWMNGWVDKCVTSDPHDFIVLCSELTVSQAIFLKKSLNGDWSEIHHSWICPQRDTVMIALVRASVKGYSLDCFIFSSKYRKVASSNMSCLEAHAVSRKVLMVTDLKFITVEFVPSRILWR